MCRMASRPALAISIHAPLAGCDKPMRHPLIAGLISIHAPLAGCDFSHKKSPFTAQISIHAPLAGCDPMATAFITSSAGFQSTHPLRGATAIGCGRFPLTWDFNPRTPCGVRLQLLLITTFNGYISIHAPLAGCDTMLHLFAVVIFDFNPRTPCGVRLGVFTAAVDGHRISIHAPLAGCDCTPCYTVHVLKDFNPRTPCGVRRGFTT